MTKRLPRDQFISPEEDWEVAYWARKFGVTRKFGVSRERLQEAVEAVGHSAEKVAHTWTRKGLPEAVAAGR